MNNNYNPNFSNINYSNSSQINRGDVSSSQQPCPENKRKNSCLSCISWLSCLIVILILIGLTLGGLVFLPGDITLLILGIDNAPQNTYVGRSDTIIMTIFNPVKPYVGMLSIPRDLWVKIPGVGENRINTAHFFAEANQAGSGPLAAIETIQVNTGVKMKYYVRIRFQGLIDIVDAMGGVDIELSEPMAGYQPGRYHLNGNKALAFARNRTGSDDFFRMKQGQFLIKSMIKQFLLPQKIVTLPRVLTAVSKSIDTNLPAWQIPRIIITLLMVGFDDIDSQVIDRQMVTSYTTDQGANVLLPQWDLITPVIDKMFGQ
ncbi:MAG: LCP family protein [Anaerolineaceae bacterium]